MIDIGDTTGCHNAWVMVRKCCWKEEKLVAWCPDQEIPLPYVPTITLHPVFVNLVCAQNVYSVRIMQAVCPECGTLYQGWDFVVNKWL